MGAGVGVVGWVQRDRDLLIKEGTFIEKSQPFGHQFSIPDLNHPSINQ